MPADGHLSLFGLLVFSDCSSDGPQDLIAPLLCWDVWASCFRTMNPRSVEENMLKRTDVLLQIQTVPHVSEFHQCYCSVTLQGIYEEQQSAALLWTDKHQSH